MRITDIKTFPTRIGFGNKLIVKVETDRGIHGWGASGLSGRELAVVGAIQHYREFLLGKDPRRIGAIWQEMYRSQYFEGGRVLTAAISAIDIALHDIKGKSLNVPVYELLGGKQRDYVDCFASLRFSTYEQLLTRARVLLDAGWNVLRLAPAEYEAFDVQASNDSGRVSNSMTAKMDSPVASADGRRNAAATLAVQKYLFEPRESIATLSDWLTKLRKEIGNGPTVGIDYHHRLSIPETVSFMQRMPEGTINFIEEPIRDETPTAYEALRRMVNVPFALGEEFASKWQFLPYLEHDIAQFARVDVCNVGGLTEAMKVVALAEAHYIDLMPHNPLGPICTAASLHLAAASPNFSWLEEINTPAVEEGTNSAEWYPVQPVLEGTRYAVPDGPGLGVEFNEELASKTEFQILEIPRLRRRDGSFTNW